MNLTQESTSARTRILLDLSHTYFSNYRTGIQRVVRSLDKELPAIAREFGVDFEAVVLKDNEFIYVDGLESQDNKPILPAKVDMLALCPRWYIALAKMFCFIVRLKAIKRWLLPEPGHQGIFRSLRKIKNAFVKPVPKPSVDISNKYVKFGPNDILLMPDGYWVMMHIWDAVARARLSGARVSVVVYDLICLTHPEFFGPGAKECFTSYLRALNQHADYAVAISQTVEKQLRKTLAELSDGVKNIPLCSNFRLGVTVENPEGKVRESVAQYFEEKESPYLMVSTFEPRKNHKFVLDSFDQFWKSYPNKRLLLVGAQGWMCEETIARIHQHALYGSQLLMINDASDAEVQFCYENCRAVIYPSVVEGFGLPIIESLRNGKTTFASDTSIHREVGKNYCEYFSLDEPSSLVTAMSIWEENECKSPSPDMDRLQISWSESSKELLRKILTMSMSANIETRNHKAA